MSESDKNQIGEGNDNYANAAKQLGNAAKVMGKKTATSAAKRGAEATVNAAAATAKAGAETGRAVAKIAAGTVAGGPWGAIISAAWSMRHTLFKVLACVCLFIVFLVILVISLPAIIFDSIFGLSGDYSGSSLTAAYAELSDSISQTINEGYSYALNTVYSIIIEGGYDYDRSMDALVDNSSESEEIDNCYVLAAYSASMQQTGVSSENMISKMRSVIDQMFKVTYEICTVEIPILSDLLEIIGTEIISFVKCVIHPITSSFFLMAFDVDLDAQYGNFNITYGEAIDFMAESLRLTLAGNAV